MKFKLVAGDRAVAYSDLMPARTRWSLELDAALRELFLTRVGPNSYEKNGGEMDSGSAGSVLEV